MYKPGSKEADMHIHTAVAIFADAAKIQVYDITDENGKQWIGQESTKIKTKRGIITFKEIKPDDELLEYIE
jgi:hypothetical protein